jgi:hypothetical protein
MRSENKEQKMLESNSFEKSGVSMYYLDFVGCLHFVRTVLCVLISHYYLESALHGDAK